MRKFFIKVPVIALFTLLFHATGLRAQQKPNIVVIITDDHTMQAIGAYGSAFGVSPNIDQLAREGAVFNRAFVTNSICAPSRAVLVTGKYSHINGHINNRTTFDGSQDQFQKQLQKGGYQTAWIGKWHLASQPQGFDFWQILPGHGHYYNSDFLTMDGGRLKTKGYVTNVITDMATAWLDTMDRSQPFCLVVGQKATHRTWMPDIKDLGALDELEIPLPENFYDDYEGRIAAHDQKMSVADDLIMGYDLKMFKNHEAMMKDGNFKRMTTGQRQKFMAYYDSIKAEFDKMNLSGKALAEWKYRRYMRDYLMTALSLDRNVGRLVDYLEQNNLMENTMIVYTSDQGFYLGEHGWFDKRFMYEESMRTPLIIRYPKLIEENSSSNELVANIDLAPTFIDLAGLPVPEEIQGQSMLPLLRGEVKGDDWREGVYYHYYEHPSEHHVYRHFGIRTDRYKLIRFYGEKNFWELYDLKKDPHEMHNLYGSKKYQKETIALKAQLTSLIKKYKDQEALKIVNTAIATTP